MFRIQIQRETMEINTNYKNNLSLGHAHPQQFPCQGSHAKYFMTRGPGQGENYANVLFWPGWKSLKSMCNYIKSMKIQRPHRNFVSKKKQ